MEAVFVTERILLLSAPDNISESVYRPAIKQISRQIQLDYGPDHYLILNVSESRSDLIRLNSTHVMDYGWPGGFAPALERLCAICKQADVWMHTSPRNVLIIHCKGGLGRAALVIASYMHYTSICATSNQALDRYAMKHFFDDELRRHILPSQRRYVKYFSGLLSGQIVLNSDPVSLSSISLIQVANFDGKAACRPCFKIYQNNETIWTSEVYSMSEAEERRILTINLRPSLTLRGDILIKCYHHKKMRPDLKDTIFRCQLHTCDIQNDILTLSKGDLDEANNDIRFREDGQVQLTFSQGTAETGYFSIQPSQQQSHHPDSESQPTLLHSRPETAGGDGGTHQLSVGWNETFAGEEAINDTTDSPGALHYSLPAPRSLSPSSDAGFFGEHSSTPYLRSHNDTYAKVQKKSSQPHTSQSLDHVTPQQPQPVVHPALSSAVPLFNKRLLPTEMDRRSPSPGGTLKSVKFRDVPSSSQIAHTVPVGQRNGIGPTYRSGNDVVDLDALQPDMEELDRVFESLQADTEDLEHKLSTHSSSGNKAPGIHKEQVRAMPTAALPPKYQIDPRRMLENETGTGLRESAPPVVTSIDGDSNVESETDPGSTAGQDGTFINSYVPQDRKGYGKKYGAFTFGLPTTRPELKPITSPQPRRRDREPPSFSVSESEQEDLYGRGRLRHVENEQTATASSQRVQAEERLYNSSAPSPSPTPPIEAGLCLEQFSITSQNDSTPNGTYSRFQRKERPQSPQTLSRRVPSPTSPRPRTPTEDERLQRLLNIEQREFIVVNEVGISDRHKTRLKEIAREGQSEQEQLVQVVGGITNDKPDPDDSSLPERKKKKTASIQAQTESRSKIDATSWLQLQHDKLMTRKYGPDYTRRKDKESALLEELRISQERMIDQVPNRDVDENRLPLSALLLREAKTPPLLRRDNDMDGGSSERENPGYAVVKSQLTRGPGGQRSFKRETLTRWQEPPNETRATGGTSSMERRVETYTTNRSAVGLTEGDTDHDSIADEVDFGDEPLYKAPPTTYRTSRSREVNESRLRSIGGGSFSNPTSPDPGRTAATSPKSILKNTSLQRGRNATSEDRAGGTTVTGINSVGRATTPHFPLAPDQDRGSLPRNNSFQRGYSLYGTRDRASGTLTSDRNGNTSGRSTPTGYFGMSNSRRSSLTSVGQAEPVEEIYVVDQNPIFVKDLSRFWYKPGITREETIQILKNKPAGTFLIRDSNSFPGAFGLAVKVDSMSNGVTGKKQLPEDLVRHFLIEPSNKGVTVKGCINEPVFASLSALVYQHSVTALALPCRLLLPESDMTLSHQPLYSEDNLQRLMDQGAACNVFYLLSLDTESLTGPQAIRRAMTHVQHGHAMQPTVVHFKVNAEGLILTDNKRRVFFRRHYPIQTVSFCGLDPDDRRWTFKTDEGSQPTSARCFGFVSRKPGSFNQNEVHLFAELESEQPAGAVVSFVTKVMMTSVSIAERRAQVAHSHSVDQKACGPFTSLDSMTLTKQSDGHRGHTST
ncbi:Tensin-1 [Hypsibius exemplaris]|uniref:Tensin-1 n=1 Tax=Hypsibius exemplaris TaxID=2072580 RepID=A0A1W0XEG5_HYPEX|nr:Tensin-1 [Hypsibius exemplaris]